MGKKYSTETATVRMACGVCAAVAENDPQTIATILHDGLTSQNDLDDAAKSLSRVFGDVPVSVIECRLPPYVALTCEVCYGTTGTDDSAWILVGVDH